MIYFREINSLREAVKFIVELEEKEKLFHFDDPVEDVFPDLPTGKIHEVNYMRKRCFDFCDPHLWCILLSNDPDQIDYINHLLVHDDELTLERFGEVWYEQRDENGQWDTWKLFPYELTREVWRIWREKGGQAEPHFQLDHEEPTPVTKLLAEVAGWVEDEDIDNDSKAIREAKPGQIWFSPWKTTFTIL